MKPANWTLQTKTFPKLLQFKGSNDDAVEFAGILQFWHRCSGIHRDFTILTHLAQLVPNLIWELPSLPHHLPFEGWLERHHYATQALQQGCCPFIHKWLWPHKGHKLFSLKKKRHGPGVRALSRTNGVLTLLGQAQVHFITSCPINPGDTAQGLG